jgi:hypothetical protein
MQSEYYLFTFKNTKDAFASEKIAQEHGISVSVVGTPTKLQVSCGFSVRVAPADYEAIRKIFAEANVSRIFHAKRNGLNVEYVEQTNLF